MRGARCSLRYVSRRQSAAALSHRAQGGAAMSLRLRTAVVVLILAVAVVGPGWDRDG